MLGEERCIQGFGVETQGKGLLERSRLRWEDNNKVDLREVECRGHKLEPYGAGYGQVVGCCECGNESSDAIKCREFF
jgi:hypothetical protein